MNLPNLPGKCDPFRSAMCNRFEVPCPRSNSGSAAKSDTNSPAPTSAPRGKRRWEMGNGEGELVWFVWHSGVKELVEKGWNMLIIVILNDFELNSFWPFRDLTVYVQLVNDHDLFHADVHGSLLTENQRCFCVLKICYSCTSTHDFDAWQDPKMR